MSMESLRLLVFLLLLVSDVAGVPAITESLAAAGVLVVAFLPVFTDVPNVCWRNYA